MDDDEDRPARPPAPTPHRETAAPPRPTQEGDRSEPKHAAEHPRLKLAVTVVGLAASLVAVITGIVGLWPSPAQPDTPVEEAVAADDRDEAAEQVRACMTQHDLATAQQVFEQPGNLDEGLLFGQVFASCDWPPPSWAAPDGYAEVHVTVVDGPGMSNADGTNVAYRIRLPCEEAEVAFTFALQGSLERLPPFFVERDRTYTIEGSEYQPPSLADRLPFYPEREEAVVVTNGHHVLDSVTCAV